MPSRPVNLQVPTHALRIRSSEDAGFECGLESAGYEAPYAAHLLHDIDITNIGNVAAEQSG